MQRYVIMGLSIGGYLVFDKPYIEHTVCRDEVNQAILVELYHTGNGGILPKDIVHALKAYELNRFQVLRRIQHMNKLLEEEIAQKVAEKHGHKWALTEFTREAYDKPKEELSEKEEEEAPVWALSPLRTPLRQCQTTIRIRSTFLGCNGVCIR